MKTREINLVDSLAETTRAKKTLERRLMETGMGVVSALRSHRISFDQAWEDFFNIDNYRALRRRRLNPLLAEFLEWGMELEDVASVTPDGLEESYQAMSALADRVLLSPHSTSH